MASGSQQWGDKVDKGKWDKAGQQEWNKGRTVETVWGAGTFGFTGEVSRNSFDKTNNGQVGGNSSASTGGTITTTSRGSGSWEEALLKSVQK